jgi:hypothetical protein
MSGMRQDLDARSDPQALVEEFAGGYRFELDEFQVRG